MVTRPTGTPSVGAAIVRSRLRADSTMCNQSSDPGPAYGGTGRTRLRHANRPIPLPGRSAPGRVRSIPVADQGNRRFAPVSAAFRTLLGTTTRPARPSRADRGGVDLVLHTLVALLECRVSVLEC